MEDDLFNVFDEGRGRKRSREPSPRPDESVDKAVTKRPKKSAKQSPRKASDSEKKEVVDVPMSSSASSSSNGKKNADASDHATDQGLKVPLHSPESGRNEAREFGQFQEQVVDKLQITGCLHEVCYPPNYDLERAREEMRTPLPPTPPAKTYPYTLDAFQKRAVNCIERRQNVLVAAHTSAGKTTVAEYAIAKAIATGSRVIYTSPIKALSNQKYRDLFEEFSDVGLMTGDVTINPSASCLVMTTEILRNMLYRGSEVVREISWVIFDEIHYMRDKSRGVIWEECLILLPKKIRFVFLSATIPNAAEFACWIAKLNRHPCNVVYTETRPVPLQHYMFPQGGKGLHLVVDEKGNFKDKNFQAALAVLSADGGGAGAFSGGRKKKRTDSKDGGDIFKLLKMVMVKRYDPVIVFAFSKRDCESNAMMLSKLDFSTDDDKKMVGQIFNNAIDSLSDDDRKLPQVISILPLLKRGIGIHHSGLLPILKEVIEILFQEGLVKCLFATETFAMGLNMPAKTVVFSGMRKFDGHEYRYVTPGEYVQMSGRAGRRGKDDKGIVVLMCNEKLDPPSAKHIFKGSADPLNSSFHLGYNMLLNLLRVEEADPEHMIQHSFHQFQATRRAPEIEEKIKEITRQRDEISINNESDVSEFFTLKNEHGRLRLRMKETRNSTEYLLPFLNPGRLVKVANGKEEWGWGVLISFNKVDLRKRFGAFRQNISKERDLYVADVLLECDPNTAKGEDPRPFRPSDAASASSRSKSSSSSKKKSRSSSGEDHGRMEIVPCELGRLDELSQIRVYLPNNLKPVSARNDCIASMKKALTKFADKGGLPLLDPIDNMRITNKDFKKTLRRMKTLEDRIDDHPLSEDDAKHQLDAFSEKLELDKKVSELETELKKLERNEMTRKTLKNMKRVLRRLGHTDSDNVVDLKGRVACLLSTADELLVTEMLLNGSLNELSTPVLVALCSCFVCSERVDDVIRLNEELGAPYRQMQEAARRIGEVKRDAKIEIDVSEYVESFSAMMMEVAYEWCKGAKFSDITKMTSIFEGSLIRVMRRLEELLGELVRCAKLIGNAELEQKFKDGIALIKRDIVFAASLYL